MSRRRPRPVSAGTLPAIAVAAALLALPAGGLAAKVAPPSTARDLAGTYFSTALTRAEVLSYVGRSASDYRIDVGRVVAVRAGSLDLRERDGTRQTILLGPQTQIVGVGRLAARAALTGRGPRVVVLRVGDGPATQIRPAASAAVLGRALFGVTFVRAEVLTYEGRTAHDVRIDEGRVVAVKPSEITLLERDGTRQAIALGSSTTVFEGGQQVDQTALLRGLTAIAIREGGGAADQILLEPAFGAAVRG